MNRREFGKAPQPVIREHIAIMGYDIPVIVNEGIPEGHLLIHGSEGDIALRISNAGLESWDGQEWRFIN